MSDENKPTSTFRIILVTAVVNSTVVGFVTWGISKWSISLFQEHSIIASLIPIISSDDGIKVQMGLHLLKKAVPEQADDYEKIINERVKKTAENAVSGASNNTHDIQDKGILNTLGRDPKFKEIISNAINNISSENKQKIKSEIEKKETTSEVQLLLTLGQKKLDEKDCFPAYLAFDAASELYRDNLVIETGKKIAYHCIPSEKSRELDRYLQEKIRKYELEAAKEMSKYEQLKEQLLKDKNKNLSPKEIEEFWNKRYKPN